MSTEVHKILLIIENKIQGDFIEMIFEDDPEYHIEKYFDGEEALDLLLNNYDEYCSHVVVMSYQLPGIDGLKIMEKLKHANLKYAIIFLTSDKTVERALEAMKAGAIDFIPKSENLQVHLPEMVKKVHYLQKDKLEQDRIKEELEENRRQLEKLSIVARETNNGVIIYDKKGKLEWINEAYEKITGYSKEEILNLIGENLIHEQREEEVNNKLKSCLNEHKSQLYTSEITSKNGETIWIQTNISPVIDEDGNLSKLVAVDSDISEIKKAEAIILKHTKNIENSIQYAKRIQDALLPSKQIIKDEKIFSDALVFLKPHSIVSGDFYWFNKIDNKIIIAAADCTGHGVPGAFMSMLGISSLNTITRRLYIKGPEYLTSDEVLNQLKSTVIKSLSQKGKSGEAQDGMDIALCIIDTETKVLNFSGAYNSLYLFRNNDLITLKADKMPIGIHRKKNKSFTSETIDLKDNDTLYMHSDGFPDQFGGSEGNKFMQKNFRNLLKKIHSMPMSEQKEIFENTLSDWKGNHPQTDDIIILGLKISINE